MVEQTRADKASILAELALRLKQKRLRSEAIGAIPSTEARRTFEGFTYEWRQSRVPSDVALEILHRESIEPANHRTAYEDTPL